MKFLIMAAGRGTRISRYIQNKPKCCVEFGGESLIKRTVKFLKELNAGEIGIVTGYQSDKVLKSVGDLQVTFYFNPFYDVTNSIASLWFAKDFISMDEDLVIMNGDLFFEKALLKYLVEQNDLPVFLADSSRIEEADYRFGWNGDLLETFGKELSNDETTGEYVGISRIGKRNVSKFVDRMHKMINTQQSGKWWEDILYSFVGSGMDVYVKDIKGTFWAELDYIEDLNRINKYIGDKKGTTANEGNL